MSRETEKIFREMQKMLEGQNFENAEQLNEFMNNYIQGYNYQAAKKQKLDSYDYLQMANEADTAEDAIKYAQKALKMDTYCLDAELIIAQAKAESIDEFKKNIERVIKKGEKQLAARGISMEEDAGYFYGILETRPYMRVRKAYLELLLEQGRFCCAISEAEELLRLSENDNLGVRYSLMALYAYFEEEEKALKLFQKYKEDSAFMLLPLVALYYKKDNAKKMRTYILKLKNSNEEIQEALEIIMSDDEEEIAEIVNSSMYAPFSMEEVILAFFESSYLYVTLNHFWLRLYEEIIA